MYLGNPIADIGVESASPITNVTQYYPAIGEKMKDDGGMLNCSEMKRLKSVARTAAHNSNLGILCSLLVASFAFPMMKTI